MATDEVVRSGCEGFGLAGWASAAGEGGCLGSAQEASVFETARSEVQEETCTETPCLEVVDDLRLFGSAELSQSLQFDDDVLEAQKVGTVGAGKRGAFVRDGKLALAFEWDSTGGKFDAEGFLVDGFEATRAEVAVDLDGL